MKFTMTKIAAAAALAFASSAAMAVPVATTAVFDMYSGLGTDMAGVVPAYAGTVGHDTTVTGFIDTAAKTWGVASATPFFGNVWTASNGQLITTAGSYSMNTTTGVVSAIGSPTTANDGNIQFTVGAGQMAGTIDFAWTVNSGIRVVNVWNVSTDGLTYTAAIAPGMENGPFPGFNAAFHIAAVPEASTYGMMLAGLGLVGFAVRRRKLMA